jgi:AcrR family transcriptional regulator
MAYRKTAHVREQLADKRIRILDAARRLVSRGGFRETGIDAVAAEAGVATGTVYRYFPSKSALFVEVVSRVSEREVDTVAAIAARTGDPEERLRQSVRQFAARALANHRLAYALIVEPSDPDVEGVRIRYRRKLAEAFASIIAAGIGTGCFRAQDAQLAGTCIVGAIMEALIGPLAHETDDAETLLCAIEQFCLQAVCVRPVSSVRRAARVLPV